MRLLLIAYEFPPSPSPQSLRWTYLVRELAQLGHQVHVLAPSTPGSSDGLPALPESVTVHRVFAGPLMGLLAWRDSHNRHADPQSISPNGPKAINASAKTGISAESQGLRQSRLNWKGKLFKAAKTAASRVLFPDSRAEWNPWAKRGLKHLLAELRPDAVVVSHEPASTIEIGMLAKKELGFPLIVDLGDPVLAPYTPGHWKKRAFQLEADVCRFAEHVTVTCQHARELLQERHRLASGRCTVISQGFDEFVPPLIRGRVNYKSPLILLYTGSFYSFRSANALLDAVMRTPGLVLEIAAINVPDEIAEAAKACPDRIRVIGFIRHSEVLVRQRAADVLVNISNADAVQVPGKLYEYLGAARPILHLGNDEKDAGRALVQDLRRGWTCPVDADSIAAQLRSIVRAYSANALEEGLDLGMDAVAPYSWRAQASKFDGILMRTMCRDKPPLSDGSVLTNHLEELHAE